MSTRFERDISVVPLGGGRYRGIVDRSWWIVLGPNGGFVAAIMAKAICEDVGDPTRRLRSISVQFLRSPEVGPVDIDVAIERQGRKVTSLSARLCQGDRVMAFATAVVATDRDELEFDDSLMPPVLPPETVVSLSDTSGSIIPMMDRYEFISTVSKRPEPGDGVQPSRCGGWMRFSEGTDVDAIALVAYCDAWWPPVFHRQPSTMMAVPTVDYVVHVMATPSDPTDWVYAEFESPVAKGGYILEDGKIWDRSGRLLAVSRQLAVLG
jgi:acyl-CoA thioesterase